MPSPNADDSVTPVDAAERAAEPRRLRMAPEERRRQLVGLGLARLVEAPGEELPVDAIAREAGISRSLLFHYFPTKADFHAEVIAAAGRRMLRNLRPPAERGGQEAVRHLVTAFLEQVQRRRDFYLALRRGATPLATDTQVHETLRAAITDLVLDALDLGPNRRLAVHAWTAYLEDLAIERAPRLSVGVLTDHAIGILRAATEQPLR